MLKIRLMGSMDEIYWFQKILDRCQELKVTEFSKPFRNKGTNRYHRVYAEVVCANQETELKED